MIYDKEDGCNPAVVAQHVDNFEKRLQGAKLKELPGLARHDLAYLALISCAYAVLEFSGKGISSDKNHHQEVLEFCAKAVGYSKDDTRRLLAKPRDRNSSTYGDKSAVTAMMSWEAVALAEKLGQAAEQRMKSSLKTQGGS